LGSSEEEEDEPVTRLGPLMGDVERFRAVGLAGLRVLTAEPRTDTSRLAGIGYCAGGTLMLELARAGVALSAVVGFHSGLGSQRPADARNITGSVLVCIGAEDPFIPAEDRLAFEQEMRDGGVDWRMNLYGGAVHSFTHPRTEPSTMAGIAYDQRSDQRSWRALLDLLAETFPSADQPVATVPSV
jgi:dienelactone hydrolase